MMYNSSFILALNAISVMIFFLLLSSISVPVEGTRLLKDESFSSMLDGFIMGRAYSGPSRRGRGH